MGERGRAPARSEERRRRNEPEHPIIKLGPAELAAANLGIDLSPEPPDVDALLEADQEIEYSKEPDQTAGWHPYARELWERLQTDPSRLWNGPAAMALDLVMCETISRHLMPQVTGTIAGNEFVDSQVVYGKVPMNGATIAAIMKWASGRGLYENDRLRIQKEVTFHASAGAPDVSPGDGSNVTSIVQNRRAIFEAE